MNVNKIVYIVFYCSCKWMDTPYNTGRTDGRTDGQPDGQTYIHTYICKITSKYKICIVNVISFSKMYYYKIKE